MDRISYTRDNPFPKTSQQALDYRKYCRIIQANFTDSDITQEVDKRFDDLAIALAEAYVGVANLRKCAEIAMGFCEVDVDNNSSSWESLLVSSAKYFRYKHNVKILQQTGNILKEMEEFMEPVFVRIPSNLEEDNKHQRIANIIDLYGMTKTHLNPTQNSCSVAVYRNFRQIDPEFMYKAAVDNNKGYGAHDE